MVMAVLTGMAKMLFTFAHQSGRDQRLKAHFSPAEIMELGMVMAVLTGMAKMLFTFDLVEKEESCPFPAQADA